MRNPILSAMNRCSWHLLFATSLMLVPMVRAETETIDLKALAKKARPAVMLLVVSDGTGKEIATGTGFLVSSDGKLITNHHVIEGAASAVAKAENGGLFPVEGVLADDPKNDIVLLKLKGKDLPFLLLCTNETVEVGARIAVIGSPLGLEGTLSEGIVSAVRDLMLDTRRIQITAAISPGSSGSPVLNDQGAVIGVASCLMQGAQSLNFAVPAEAIRKLLASATEKPISLAGSESVDGSDDSAIFHSEEWKRLVIVENAKDWVESLKAAQVLARRFADDARAHDSLGAAYAHLGFYDDAVAAYRQAIKLKPDYSFAWCDLALAYGEQGRYDDAVAAYRQAIKLRPDYATAWSALGGVYVVQGKDDDAIAACRQAVTLKPDDPKYWFLLAWTYELARTYDDAIAAHRQAIKLKPDDPQLWYGLGMDYGALGKRSEARDALDHLRKLDSAKADKLADILSSK